MPQKHRDFTQAVLAQQKRLAQWAKRFSLDWLLINDA
jgi:hypothetical protein